MCKLVQNVQKDENTQSTDMGRRWGESVFIQTAETASQIQTSGKTEQLIQTLDNSDI